MRRHKADTRAAYHDLQCELTNGRMLGVRDSWDAREVNQLDPPDSHPASSGGTMLSKLLRHRLATAFRKRYGTAGSDPTPAAEHDTISAVKAAANEADRLVASAIAQTQDGDDEKDDESEPVPSSAGDGMAGPFVYTSTAATAGPPPEQVQWSQIEALLQHSPTLAVLTAVRHALRKRLVGRVHGGELLTLLEPAEATEAQLGDIEVIDASSNKISMLPGLAPLISLTHLDLR